MHPSPFSPPQSPLREDLQERYGLFSPPRCGYSTTPLPRDEAGEADYSLWAAPQCLTPLILGISSPPPPVPASCCLPPALDDASDDFHPLPSSSSSSFLSSLPSSTDSSIASDRPSSSPPSSPSPSPTPLKRRRPNPSTPKRCTRRSHSAIDALRRQREAAIVHRLEELTEREEGGEKGGRVGQGGRVRSKREKLQVLQSSVERIEALAQMVDTLTKAANAKDERVQRLLHHVQTATRCPAAQQRGRRSSSPLSLLPRGVASLLTFLDGQHSLYSSFIAQGRLSMLVLEVHTGRVVDANALFYELSGWDRREVIDSLLGTEKRHLVQWQEGQLIPDFSDEERKLRPLVRRRPWHGDSQPIVVRLQLEQAEDAGDDEVEGEEVELIPCPRPKQYPGSLLLTKELMEGKRTSFRAPWRSPPTPTSLTSTHCWLCSHAACRAQALFARCSVLL